MINHPLFENVDISKYQNEFIIEKYAEGTLLFHEGDECELLGIILKGQVVISTVTLLGKEYTINILNKNEIFGDTLLFSEKTLYLGNIITSKDSEILYISKELLMKMFKEQNFLINFLSLTSEKSLTLRNRLKLFSHNNIRDRILFYLSAKSKELKTNVIPIKSKEILAQILNIPRPSLSRELIKLKDEKIIEYDKYYIKLII